MAPPPGFPMPTTSSLADIAATATATAAAAAATSTQNAAAEVAAAAAAAAAAGIEPGGNGDCQLLGSFSLVVQAALGGLAMLSLVYKRWRERPQRPVKIWFFDVSKQVFGSVLVHIANVFMSMLTSGRFSVQAEPANVGHGRRWLYGAASMAMVAARGEEAGAGAGDGGDGYTPNPCSFYLLNLAIDTTIGIPILIGLLKLFTSAASYTPWGTPPESIRSGNYGHPPNAWWWLKQSVIYFMGLFGMKLIVLLIFILFPWISRVGDWALGWTEGNEQLQIFFVMMFFPLIMNALQYYVIDSFIKAAETSDHRLVPDEDPDWGIGNAGVGPYGDDDARGLIDSSDEDDDDDHHRHRHHHLDRNESNDGTSVRMQRHQLRQSKNVGDKQMRQQQQQQQEEYDPDLDGEAATVVGSSRSGSSWREEPSTQVPQELYPKV